MPQKIVITGANRGIGLSLAKLYKKFGCDVFAICRSSSSELSTLGVNVIDGVDVGDDKKIKTLSDKLAGVEIDVLINNAGILQNEILGEIDYQSIQQQLDVNAIAPLKISELLAPQIKAKTGKIILITSRMGSIEDNTSGGRYGYRMSKAALNIAGVSLSHDLKEKGISVAIIHPGLVATDMTGPHGQISSNEAAERIDKLIYGLNLENSGTFWHSNGEVLPW